MKFFTIVLVLLLVIEGHAAEEPLANWTIVIYNKASPESVELAKFYAEKRGIARDHMIGLACSLEEEISREEYDTTIANPLRDILQQRGWWTVRKRESPDEKPRLTASMIRFAAVIKGVPLKIRSTQNYPGDKQGQGEIGTRNEASVDSELSVLGFFTPEISGALGNSYYKSYRPIREFGDSPILLVSRLDAPTVSTVKRMITDAVEVEKTGLWGRAFVDGAHNVSGGMALGDKWLNEAQTQLHKAGVPVVYDEAPAIFPVGFPISDCVLYYGWYAENVSGTFAQPGDRFSPGAVAVHIHSFSASTLRDANAAWVGPLVQRGAAASMGNVYEPYLQLTSNLNIFNDRLLHGFTLAESAYMSLQALSWMTIVVGDPLYRPYAAWLQLDGRREVPPPAANYKMYHDFAVKNASVAPAEFSTKARVVASRAKNGPMLEDLGLMEMRGGNFAAATSYFQQARTCYSKRDDILRVVIVEAEALAKQNKPKKALELIRSVTRIVSDSPTTVLLKKMEAELGRPDATLRRSR